jgi:predicted Zn finger-like uncharacterized protein
MIVRCPSCSTRFRLDRGRLKGKRVTLRCVRCRNTFKVDVIDAPPEKAPLKVLVAHADAAIGDTMVAILEKNGIATQVCQRGDEVLPGMEAFAPQVVVIDVALPGLFAFEVIGRIRAHPFFKKAKVVLLSSVYNQEAYKRRPSSLYGADDFVEGPHIERDLLAKILALWEKFHAPGNEDNAPREGAGSYEEPDQRDKVV